MRTQPFETTNVSSNMDFTRRLSPAGQSESRSNDRDSLDIVNAFTVDVEDYFQVQAFSKTVHRREWSNYQLRVVPNTHRILRLLRRHDVRATFFVLGWVADRCPTLVREILKDGHEIGSHSYWHRLIYEMTPEEFAADLRQSCDALSHITGLPIKCYRAPCFSITRRSMWAIDVLAEHGIEIDSSIFPVRHDVYGIPKACRHVHCVKGTDGSSLWEAPPAVRRVGGWNVPVAGGGYFRLYPSFMTHHWYRRINQERQPVVFYIHPWEVDAEQPRLRSGSLLRQYRHRVNLARTESKLNRLLSRFRFGTVSEVVHQVRSRETLLYVHAQLSFESE
jgi:polysaccharide deacetylase family protein (PEP-CTERM system associated)